jgi:hypothetical protein
MMECCYESISAVRFFHPNIFPGPETMISKRFAVLLAALVIGALSSCASTEECGTCSGDADCRSGFFCSTFSDGTRRCASGMGDSTCGKK